MVSQTVDCEHGVGLLPRSWPQTCLDKLDRLGDFTPCQRVRAMAEPYQVYIDAVIVHHRHSAWLAAVERTSAAGCVPKIDLQDEVPWNVA